MDIDPNLQSIVLGVLANGLTALIASSYCRSKALVFGENLHKEGNALNNYIRSALEKVAEEVEWEGDPPLEEVCLFLISGEVEAVVRQLYSARIATEGDDYLKGIKKEFSDLFSYYFGIGKADARADYLFEVLKKGTAAVLEQAINQRVLSAHEANSVFRQHQIMDELMVVRQNLELLISPTLPRVQNILDFEKAYRTQVTDRHKEIVLPFLDAVPRLPIKDAYVLPRFIRKPLFRQDEESEKIDFWDFLSTSYRTVILGQPGGGKSTFTQKLAHDLSKRYSERLFLNREVTPIIVILREYGADKKTRHCSILQHIESVCNERYQLEAPPKSFKYMLLNGRAVVIFDGLDELLDTNLRREITADVESFCNLYPSIPVVVTSREVGYAQAPLNPKKFETFRLAPFEEEDVKQYVNNWFRADERLSNAERTSLANAFLKESEIVPDLRSNPLMLALMCNIYRGGHYIPKNRPEVYRKCAEMLYERWDKWRNINAQFRFESDLRPALAYLAHWIYSDEKLKGGVTERALIQKTTSYLLEKRYEDKDKSEMAAREFIEFCKGRAWVFSDTGTTRNGESLYQFTHTTFLEYFTALYLNRTHETVPQLLKELLPRISKREWDVVAQLAFQIKSSEVEDAGDKLLTGLLSRAKRVNLKERWYLLSFAARCLKFIIPSPKIVRDITEACIEQLTNERIARLLEKQEKDLGTERNIGGDNFFLSPQEILLDLLYPAPENLSTVQSTFKQRIETLITGSNVIQASLAFEIVIHIVNLWDEENVTASWKTLSTHILDSNSRIIESLYPRNLFLCSWAVKMCRLSIAKIVEWHGLEALFLMVLPVLFDKELPIAVRLLPFFSSQQGQSDYRSFSEQCLRELSDLFLSIEFPCIFKEQLLKKGEYDVHPLLLLGAHLDQDHPFYNTWINTLKDDMAFGFFALLASLLELGDNISSSLRMIRENSYPSMDSFRWTLISRYKDRDDAKVEEEINNCEYSDKQKDIVWRWVRRELSFVV